MKEFQVLKSKYGLIINDGEGTVDSAASFALWSVVSRTHNSERLRKICTVPSSSQKMLDKSRGLTVDCVAYDLEDSVTLNKKADARMNLRRFLERDPAAGIKEYAVRINPVGSGLEAEDMEAVVCKAKNLGFFYSY